MESPLDYSLLLSFAREVEDFRTGNRLHYPSSSIIFMGFIGVLCGGENWEDIVEIAESSEDLLSEHLGSCFVGVPSHDTFSRFFSLLNPSSLERSFRKTMSVLQKRLRDGLERSVSTTSKEVVALDGKYAGAVTDVPALNVVTAYATDTGLCLGQEVADKKMNEPEQLRKLVSELYLAGTIITADALHCQKESAQAIKEAKADYLLIVKANQAKLYEGILEGIRVENNRGKAKWIDHAEERTRGHGRREVRICHSCSHLGWLPQCGAKWEGLKSFGTITWERTVLATGETTKETRCFISSLEKDAPAQLNIIRDHWKIENNLHWQLDVSFHEDDTRMNKNQLLNLAILRKMAMPVLKDFTYKKGASIKKKMLAAALKPKVKKLLVQQAMELFVNV